MSWKIINKMLGRAMIDQHFAAKLLANPLKAAREGGFDLTPEEQEIIEPMKAKDVAELGQMLLAQLDKLDRQS